MKPLTLTEALYNDVLAGKVIQWVVDNKQEYDSMRINFLQRFKRSVEMAEEFSANPYEGQYFRCTWDAANRIGTFQLAPEDKKLHDGKAAIFKSEDL